MAKVRFTPLTPVRDQLLRSHELPEVGQALIDLGETLSIAAAATVSTGKALIICARAQAVPVAIADMLAAADTGADRIKATADHIKRLVGLLSGGDVLQ